MFQFKKKIKHKIWKNYIEKVIILGLPFLAMPAFVENNLGRAFGKRKLKNPKQQ